jgi:phosphohistidine swiveling domain-containing protein
VSTFGFLLAPFNLGTPPSTASILERLLEGGESGGSAGPVLDLRSDHLQDLPDSVRELGLLTQELTYWKTERLDVMSLGDARGAEMYREAAELLSIDTSHLFAMRRSELEASIQSGSVVVDLPVLDERLAGYCLLLSDGEIGFYEPSRKPAVNEAIESAPDEGGLIRGVAASRGKATGPVRILIDPAQKDLLKPGEVLVTTMTRPEMGAALDKAVAFVTDQGGRMSHAAIISREMGKPCVIGTEVATQRLRDGMTVTVDGDEGIVVVVQP